MVEKRSGKLNKVFGIIACIILGGLAGVGAGFVMNEMLPDVEYTLFMFIIILAAAYFLNVILHEAGHLVMGLATGYRFLSFRILSLILIRNEDGSFSFRRFSIPGTLGQCLLVPPEMDDEGQMPVMLYNLGGVMMNFMIAIVCALVVIFSNVSGYRGAFIACFGMVGLITGLLNVIPLTSGGVNNDGANIRQMRNNPRAVRSLYRQLMVNAYQTRGMMLSDMPDDLFEMPSADDMSDSLVSAEGVFVENLLMEKMDHEKTLKHIDFMLNTEGVNLMDVYRVLLGCDRLLVNIMLGNSVTVDRNMRKNLRQFSMFPDVLAARYAVSHLVDKDEKEAEKLSVQFDKMIRRYPFECDRVTYTEYMNELRNRNSLSL